MHEAQPSSLAVGGPGGGVRGRVWATAVPRDHLGSGLSMARSAECVGDATNRRNLPMFKGGHILKSSLGSREIGLDSTLRAVPCHPLPSHLRGDSDMQMSTLICIELNVLCKAVFQLAPSLYVLGKENVF